MNMRMKIVIALFPVALLIVVILRVINLDAPMVTKGQAPTLVKVELPKREAVARSLQLTGDALPIQQAQVFARVYGNIESIKANIGDYVSAGRILAQVDTVELAQQYRQAAATYQNAEKVYERAKSLQNLNLISKQDFDSAETSMEVAKENSKAAKTRLDYAQITAPFSGFITRRYLDAGAVLTAANATLFTLMDIDIIKIIVNVLEKDIPSINVGTKAVITVDAFPGKEFDGSITRLSQELDLDTRTMPVEIDVPNANHDLKPGMFATVRVDIGNRVNALTVPTQAVLKDDKGYYVLIADKNLAHRADVTIGTEQQSRTEIVSGLGDSNQVIITGQQFARDGGPITIQP
jgi:RND family efflux transporter MFP subunit